VNFIDSNRLSTVERLAEVAAILAAGVVRLTAVKSSGQSVLPEKSVVDFVPDQSGGAVETSGRRTHDE
jgi:hypothetical protein